MLQEYTYQADESALRNHALAQEWTEAFDALAQPLHEALYKEQDFSLLDRMTVFERLILSFDYVQAQVGQGGFIQLIQNDYISLLIPVIESLQTLNMASGMITVLDDVLKVFVLNKEILGKEASVAEFGKLYSEFKEFEGLEQQFAAHHAATLAEIINYAIAID